MYVSALSPHVWQYLSMYVAVALYVCFNGITSYVAVPLYACFSVITSCVAVPVFSTVSLALSYVLQWLSINVLVYMLPYTSP
jgi:uncharacterized membrane protein